MAQQAFPLRTVGYAEPPITASYPFLPVHHLDMLAERAGGFAWLRSMVNAYGHCAQ